MRWPWSKSESREAGGEYHDAIIALAEAQAAGKAADTGRTAAVEAAAGLLSRAFMAAQIDAADWIQNAVAPSILGQIARDLVRQGESLHVIRMDRRGTVRLRTAADWHWHGGTSDPESWMVRATCYGPSSSETWLLPAAQVVFAAWGSGSGTRYRGRSPITWGSLTSRLAAESERTLADESGGPLAQILPIPADGGDGSSADPLKTMKAGLAAARGKAVFMETTSAGWGGGMGEAPRRDWIAGRLGPNPSTAQVEIARQSFERVLAACGIPPSLFAGNADGTSQREGLRRWHMSTVLPLARMLEHELTAKLGSAVKLRFDGYAMDMVSRASVASKLAAVEGVSVQQALEIAGLIENE